MQVTLHNHPRNAQRVASGLPPINSLWFWGAGSYPAHVATAHAAVHTDDVLLRSLATAAAVDVHTLPERWQPSLARSLVDLRHARDIEALAREWIVPAIDALSSGTTDKVIMDFMDGSPIPAVAWTALALLAQAVATLSVPAVESQAPSP